MVEKITTYRFTCDLCGATVENEGSLPDGWKSGYNHDVQICSKCSKDVFIDEVDKAIHTIRDFCRSHTCTMDCPLSFEVNSGDSCRLSHRPTGYHWTSAITKLNQDKGKYQDILNALDVLRKHCCGRQCHECRFRRGDESLGVKNCLFETCNPTVWEAGK